MEIYKINALLGSPPFERHTNVLAGRFIAKPGLHMKIFTEMVAL